MGIETILKQHISSIKYYENLPCILVNGSQLFETDDKYIHKDLKRLNELNIINPLKKIMTDDNLTDKLNYSSLGVTVSKAINQFEISAVSKKYILFISEYIREQKNLTDYISIAEFIRGFIHKSDMTEKELNIFSYCINKYFHTNLHLFVHNKMKVLYLESISVTEELYQCLKEDEGFNLENKRLNDFTQKHNQTYTIINDYLNVLSYTYTKSLNSAIVDLLKLYVNPDKADVKTQKAINKILDVLENCNDFFKIHAQLDDINENIDIIVDDLRKYTKNKNEKIIKRSENIIAAFKDATSLLICKKQILILFFNKYLASLIYQNYFKLYSIFKINDFCVGSNFNELEEYIWNNPYDTDEIYEYIQKNLKDQKFTSIDFTEKTLKIPDFDDIDILVCKILSGINFAYPCVNEKLIYITVNEVTKEGKN